MERKYRFLRVFTACLLTLLFLLTLVPTAMAAPDETAITLSGNAPLYYGLIWALPGKLDPARTGIITVGQLNALTANDIIYIDGSNDNNYNGNRTDDKVTSLDGLEACTGVTKICLLNNALTDGSLSVLENLPQLKVLDLRNNTTLFDISSLSTLYNLEELYLQGDTNITSLPVDSVTHDMSKFTSLYKLSLGGYLPQNIMEPAGPLMNLMGVAYYQTINTIPRFRTLNPTYPAELSISNSNIANASFLNDCGGLTRINWMYTPLLTDAILQTLHPFPVNNLNYIDVSCNAANPNALDNAALAYIAGLTKFSNASAFCTLCISGCTGITSVQNLSPALGLKVLYWQHLPGLTAAQASTVCFLPQLINIDFANDVGLGNTILSTINGEDASHVKYLPNLVVLGIGNCNITDLSSLEGKNTLRSLSIGLNKITSIAPLSAMPQLSSVTMNNNYVSSLAPFINGAPSLTTIYCEQNCLDATPGSQDMQDIGSIRTLHPGIKISAGSQLPIDVNYNIKPADTGKGTADKASDSVYVEQTFTPSAVTITNPAYKLVGWDTNDDGTADIPNGSTAYVPGNHVYLPSTVDYYAVFGPASYTVTYDSQQGNAVAPVTKNYGETITSEPVTARTGYTFGHWYPTSACDTAAVTFPHSVLSNETLFAKWTPNTYAITYHANNGTSDTTTSSHAYDAVQALKSNAFSKTGYIFTGWATSAAGTAAYSDGQSVKNLSSVNGGNIDLYAVWSQNVFTVSFDAQGGAVGSASMAVTYNAPYGALPTPTRAGYSFAGWYTDGGARVTDMAAVTIAANHTLHAVWQFMGPFLGRVDLSCGSWQKAFVKTAYSYKIRLGENDPAMTLTPIKEYDGATMTIGGKAQPSVVVSPVSGKSTTVKVVVKYGKLKKTYTFTVTRDKSANNNLSSLTAAGGTLDSPFDPADTSYVLNVDQNTKSVTIKAAAAAGKLAKVSPASKKITLNNGDTKVVNITVKAQSGAKKTYTITVKRAPSSDSSLKSLKVSGAVLSPALNAGVGNYSVVIPASKGSITLSAQSSGYKSAVYIDDVKRTSLKVALANGESKTVRIRVVAQSGDTRDYYINVQRQ